MCFAPQLRALFRHLNFWKCSENQVFLAFWLPNLLRATAAGNFWCHICPGVSSDSFSSLTVPTSAASSVYIVGSWTSKLPSIAKIWINTITQNPQAISNNMGWNPHCRGWSWVAGRHRAPESRTQHPRRWCAAWPKQRGNTGRKWISQWEGLSHIYIVYIMCIYILENKKCSKTTKQILWIYSVWRLMARMFSNWKARFRRLQPPLDNVT